MDQHSLRSKRLKNVKTVARDNLANERTFLAWLRTSIACVSVGIAMAQLLRFAEKECQVGFGSYTVIVVFGNIDTWALGKPFAVVCIVLGIIVLLTGFGRFYYVERSLVTDLYPKSTVSAFIMAVAAAIITILYVVSSVKIIYGV